MSDRKNMRTRLSIWLLVLVAGITIFYFIQHREDFRLITTVSMGPVAIVSFLKLSEIYIRGREFKIVTDHYHLNLRFSQWFGLTRIMAFTNLFLPSLTGTSVKAVYLKKFHNLRYSSFIALTGITNILRLMLYALFSFILILFSGRVSPVLLTVSGMFFVFSVIFLLFGRYLPIRLLARIGKLSRVLEEWDTIRKNHGMIVKVTLLNILIFVLFSLQIYFSFLVFMENASILSSGIISSFTIFSRVVKVIPANLGLKEAVFSAISDFYGLGFNEGLHAAALHRIVGVLFILFLAPGFVPTIFGRRNIKVNGDLPGMEGSDNVPGAKTLG